jgi:hypothetical protein
MKTTALGALAGAVLVMVAIGTLNYRSEVYAQRPAPQYTAGQTDKLIAVPGPAVDKGQLLTVIDPKLRAMSVYHIDHSNGTIRLCSVRNIHWDLQMAYHNNEGLLPQEIQAGLEQLEPR